jgi:hypothetical protein
MLKGADGSTGRKSHQRNIYGQEDWQRSMVVCLNDVLSYAQVQEVLRLEWHLWIMIALVAMDESIQRGDCCELMGFKLRWRLLDRRVTFTHQHVWRPLVFSFLLVGFGHK